MGGVRMLWDIGEDWSRGEDCYSSPHPITQGQLLKRKINYSNFLGVFVSWW